MTTRMLSAACARVPAAAGRMFGLLSLASLALVAGAGLSHAAPFVWDNDGDRLDDRIESVHLVGYAFSFEDADTLLRQRIDVTRAGVDLLFGVYVVYEQPPGDADRVALALLGMPVLHRFEAVSAYRSIATFAQADAAAELPGVERIEAVPLVHPLVRDGAATIAARDETETVFPTWAAQGSDDGEGVVVAILDTGINDAPDGSYPGHEALIGRCLGGATVLSADSSFNTPRDGSTNPVDRGGPATLAHGTHVAGIILGSGGPSGFARGVAPAARFVDVKALSDLGTGVAIAEALDWCIHNRDRDWGAGAAWHGIDVINLSLSSTDLTDGNDLASRLATRAAELGVVVVASMGNDAKSEHVPSPAGGDGVLAVGAMDAQRSPGPGDDGVAAFNNLGPRASDGDAVEVDELKPDVLAPGVAVLAADGDLGSSGGEYRRGSGTSAAAAFVSGAVALLRSRRPELDPAAIGTLLRSTGDRALAAQAPGDGGADPRWRSTIGFGCVDLSAAGLEAEDSTVTQVVRVTLASDGTSLTAGVTTQRERGAAFLVFERAPDAGGVPGAFAPRDSAAAQGTSGLAAFDHRETYTWNTSIAPAERGQAFWYRAAWTEHGTRHVSPARRFVLPAGAPAVTLEFTIVHNAYDSDLDGAFVLGSAPAVFIPLPGSSAAWQSDWVTGIPTSGNVAWSFRVPLALAQLGGQPPPAPGTPWQLQLDEGGFLNRHGRLIELRAIVHGASGDETVEGGPIPLVTLEGSTVFAVIPYEVAGVGSVPTAGALRAMPNPARPGASVSFSIGSEGATEVAIFDLAGRRVGLVPLVAGPEGARGTWSARDASGAALAPGVYLARAARGAAARIVLLGP